MRTTQIMMGMPITVEVVGIETRATYAIRKVFDYFRYIDEKFSTFKDTSEITRINTGVLSPEEWSADMKEVMALAEQTKQETNGYFDIVKNKIGYRDPSGIVKGWAIQNATHILEDAGSRNYYIDAGGDIALLGCNKNSEHWRVGIRNPFNQSEIIKVIAPCNHGVATSGTYERGAHIYNPRARGESLEEVVSLTVIGPNVYEADRFATAAFAMGKSGIEFIERYPGLEGYQIDKNGIATMTTGFVAYVI